MIRTIDELINYLFNDKDLQEAVKRVYYEIEKSNKALFESQIATNLISSKVLGNNFILHGSYVRTALDILVSEDFLTKKRAKYFKKN